MAEKNQLESNVYAKLRGLRRMLRGRLTLEALAWLSISLVTLVVVTLAFDFSLHLQRDQRVLILGLCGLGVLAVLWRALLSPLMVTMDTENLALLVERRYGQLDDRLISALQLADRSSAVAVGMSGAMIDRMTAEANSMVAGLKFSTVVEARRMGKVWAFAGALLILLGGFAVMRPDIMRLWYQRNILLANVDWPQHTYLSVYYVDRDGQLQPLLDVAEDGSIRATHQVVRVLRGEDLRVVVATAAGSQTPDFVTLHAWYPSAGNTEDQVHPLSSMKYRKLLAGKLSGGEREAAIFTKTFPSVSEEFRFHVSGGDDRRDGRSPHQVRLVNAPALKNLRFVVEYHPYMRRGDRLVLDGGRGVLPLPPGATVHVEAVATKDLQSAKILIDGTEAGKVTLSEIPGSGDPSAKRRLAGSFSVATDKAPPRTATLKFDLKDTDGYTNRRGQQYILQLLSDRPPSVMLRSRGVRQVVCPSAMIPLIGIARDDNGVKDIRVFYRAEEAQSDNENGSGDKLSQPAAEPDIMVGLVIKPIGEVTKVLRDERILDIEPLKLKPGMRILARARAVDLLPKSLGGPNVGSSDTLTFHVISRQEMLAQLVGKLKEVSMEFDQAIWQQQLSRDRCEAVGKSTAAGKIGPPVRARLKDAGNKQRLVTNESTKVADTLEAVASEMELNRLGKAEDHQLIRLEIVAPLQSLIQQMDKAATDLAATVNISDAGKLAEESRRIAEEQADIVRKMEEIRKLMKNPQNRLEIARRLENLLKMTIEMDTILRQQIETGTVKMFEDEK